MRLDLISAHTKQSLIPCLTVFWSPTNPWTVRSGKDVKFQSDTISNSAMHVRGIPTLSHDLQWVTVKMEPEFLELCARQG